MEEHRGWGRSTEDGGGGWPLQQIHTNRATDLPKLRLDATGRAHDILYIELGFDTAGFILVIAHELVDGIVGTNSIILDVSLEQILKISVEHVCKKERV
jgi:hypothetical protein